MIMSMMSRMLFRRVCLRDGGWDGGQRSRAGRSSEQQLTFFPEMDGEEEKKKKKKMEKGRRENIEAFFSQKFT
jgi:hypothetical protein